MIGRLAVMVLTATAAALLVAAASAGSPAQTLCFGSEPTITGSGEIAGTPGDDVILGSEGADRIRGFTGNDKICGLGGDDRIGGGPGDDQIDGGAGDDEIDGGQGSDTVLGGDGDDLIRCGTEDDVADGGAGANVAVTSGFETCEKVTNVMAGGGAAVPAPKQLDVKLTAGQAVPRASGTSSAAGGRFAATLTPTGTGATLVWRLTFNRLTGTATAAHLHLAKPGKAGPVIVKLCGPCPNGVRGTVAVEGRELSQAIVTGSSYVDVHTKRNLGGELRGQIPAVT